MPRIERLSDPALSSIGSQERIRKPSGNSDRMRAAISPGSCEPYSSRSRYSARLSVPTGQAGPKPTRGFGLKPRVWGMGSVARRNVRSSADMVSRWLSATAIPSFA